MLMGKWNYETHEYDLYETPIEWNVKCVGVDMDEIVNCAACGRELKYGDCYTSKELHTGGGIGYGVCWDCYQKEWERREKYG